jgi:hypothetical protein
MRNLLLGVVTLSMALVPVFGDVIPTRRADPDAGAEQKIKARLQSLGMSSADADRHVADLTPADANYFAQDLNRVQYASGLYWYEWVGGLVMLTAVIIIAVVQLNKHN